MLKEIRSKPDVVAYACNPNIQETESGGSCVGGQPELHNETCLKTKQKTNNNKKEIKSTCNVDKSQNTALNKKVGKRIHEMCQHFSKFM
jgi:hypothetical protein